MEIENDNIKPTTETETNPESVDGQRRETVALRL